MGYETTILIGKTGLDMPEHEKDTSLQYADGSGHPHKRDDNGDFVPTGRTTHYFSVYATIDLSKCGYDSEISALEKRAHELAKAHPSDVYYHYYRSDGNTETKEDCYGSPFYPVPIGDLLEAVRSDTETSADQNGGTPYRRFAWALALLESMASDPDELQAVFYSH